MSSSVRAIGNGDICETDHFDDTGDGVMTTYYTKWVTLCGSQGPLPSAMYQVIPLYLIGSYIDY